MLARHHRLTRAADFTEVVRAGRRASRPLLTVHLVLDPDGPHNPNRPNSPGRPDGPPPRAGLVVGKAVGGAVERKRVSRRLRHLLREALPDLPAGSRLVVRAAPAAAGAPSARLLADLQAALARARR